MSENTNVPATGEAQPQEAGAEATAPAAADTPVPAEPTQGAPAQA